MDPSTIVVLALVGISILFRIYALGRLPGINGDEAWYAVQAARIAGGGMDWRTPSGNLPGPFQLGSMLALRTLLPPSFVLLRVPSVLASLGAMALAYAIGRRFLDPRAAQALLLLTAALPVDIAYARFGWDPSWTVLVNLGAAWFALGAHPTRTALLFLVALFVHPTNIFVAPFLLLTLAGVAWQAHGTREALRRGALLVALMLIGIACLGVTAASGRAVIATGFVPRVLDPGSWFAFGLLYARLLSGDTIYAYIAGAGLGRARGLADAAVLLLLGGVTAVGASRFAGRDSGREIGVATGWLASVAAFYLIVGTRAEIWYTDRYSLCLIVPTLIAVVTLARVAIGGGTAVAACLVAAPLLAGFATCYLMALESTGSLSKRAFWTGAIEPKQAAFALIRAEAAPRGGARIVAEDYWLYQPLAYLASGTPLTVVQAGDPGYGPAPGGVYRVTFGGSAMDRVIAAGGARPRWTVSGTARAALIRIWWSPPPSFAFRGHAAK